MWPSSSVLAFMISFGVSGAPPPPNKAGAVTAGKFTRYPTRYRAVPPLDSFSAINRSKKKSTGCGEGEGVTSPKRTAWRYAEWFRSQTPGRSSSRLRHCSRVAECLSLLHGEQAGMRLPS